MDNWLIYACGAIIVVILATRASVRFGLLDVPVKGKAKKEKLATTEKPKKIGAAKSRTQIELEEFHSMPPVLSGWPSGYECKRLERTKDGWDAHWGRTNSHVASGIARLHPRTIGFVVDGKTILINDGRPRL